MFGRSCEQVQAGQTGKAVDAPVDAARHLAALVAREEVAGQELGLGGGHHAGADRVPEMTKSESCDPPGPRAACEPRLCLGGVEINMAALLTHDAAEQFGEDWMAGETRQSLEKAITRKRACARRKAVASESP